MADNLEARYADADSNTLGPLRFKEIGGVLYAVSILAQEDGTLLSTFPVSAASLPLPTGAATEAKQDAGNALLGTIDADTGAIVASAASIDGKTPALGQALASGSTPVVLPETQISALTPPAAITNFATETTQQQVAAAVEAIQAAQLPDGHNVTVTGTVTANIGTAGTLATAANQTAGNSSLSTIAGAVSGSEMQVDVVTMPTVQVTGTFWQATQPISAAALPLPAGAATLSEQQSQTTSLSRLAGKYVDFDTGAGTDSVVALGLLLPGNGGSVIGGTSSNPIRIDPTGTTTQPVSLVSVPSHPVTNAGTFPVQVSSSLPAGTNNIGDVDVLSLPALPAGSNTIGAVNLAQYTPASGRLPVDGSGVTQPVSNAGTFAVQATLQAGTNYAGKVRLTDGTNDATLLNLTNSKPIPTAIVDGDGTQITSFGGGTQYTEGTEAAEVTGTAAMWRDAGDVIVPVSALKPFPVEIIAGAGSGGTAAADDADFIAGTTQGTPAMGVYESTPSTVTDGDLGVVGITANRQLKTSASQFGTWTVELGSTDNAVLDAIAGSLNVIDDWDESDRAKVNPIAGQAGVQGGSGAVSANTQRVVLATDVALPTGSNTIGAVNLAQYTPASGRLPVDGSGVTQPVSIAAAVAVTDNSGSLTVDAPVGTPVHVRLSDGSSAISTLPVSLASVPSHAVTNVGTFAVQVNGDALTSLQLIDDGIATTGSAITSKGFAAVGTDGTNARILKTDASGELQVDVLSMPSTAVTNAGTFAVQAAQSGPWNIGTVSTVTTVEVVTDVGTLDLVNYVTAMGSVGTLDGAGIGHDQADSTSNPHKIGARATTSISAKTMVGNDDRTNLHAGVDGVLITRPHCNLEDIVSGVQAITDGSSTSIISAQGAGIKTYITAVIIANTSATPVTVDLRDGTGGSVKATYPAPANTGGCVHNLPTPLPFSANTAVAADPSAAASTVTVTLIGFKSKV